MNKKLLILVFVCSMMLIPQTFARTTSTILEPDDYIVYKARFNFEGVSLSDVVYNISGYDLDAEERQILATIIDAIEQCYLKLTVLEVTNTSITGNVYLYYNQTLNVNENGTVEIDETYPFLLNPNAPHTEILGGFVVPIEIQDYVNIDTLETTKFYAGRNRLVNTITTVAPNVLQHLNQSELPEPLQGLSIDISAHADWDKEYGIFLGAGVSFRLSGLSYFSYNALEVYASETNLWDVSSTDTAMNAFTGFFTNTGSDLVTYAIDGFIFGNPESKTMFIIYAVGITVALLLFSYILVKLLRRKKE